MSMKGLAPKKLHYWHGSAVCDICGQPIKKNLYDAATWSGSWATMCERDWRAHTSQRLGTGSGQHYIEQPNGRFLKF